MAVLFMTINVLRYWKSIIESSAGKDTYYLCETSVS